MRRNPKVTMLARARDRARIQSLPFDLTVDDFDIPSACPALGIPLRVSAGRATANSPSLDRLDPLKGYVRGNVVVISHRANTLKRDATIDEMEAMAGFFARYLTPAKGRRKVAQ